MFKWPSPEARLLSFDDEPPELRAFLNTAFRGPPGDTWVFKVAPDGQAPQVSGRVLRPGQCYVLLRRQPTEHPAHPRFGKSRSRVRGFTAFIWTFHTMYPPSYIPFSIGLGYR